ncbi:MAG: S-methyl-5-thioribose-1-phosphate isomerase [Candidatus Bilamarchaeaceae archaeon]
MQQKIKDEIKDIKSLKIQGARNVAKAALDALILQARLSKAKNIHYYVKELTAVKEILAYSRPTEPMMRNLLDDAIDFLVVESKKVKSMDELREIFVRREKEVIERLDQDAKKIYEYGARLIPKGYTVMTYCHSSTVTGILKKAREKDRTLKVIVCETRPRYQGRITAKELAEAGIDTTLIVDGAVNMFMKKTDLVLVGADSVTSRGDLINKVGTSTLAHIARMHDVSFYSAAELFKYSRKTFEGELEKIEERDKKEVWEDAPKKVKIRNPAFDVTSAKYINGYITEVGVIPPQSFFALATEKLGLKIFGR